MTTLFNDSEVFQKERPTFILDEQKTAFYKKMAQEIIKSGWSTSDEEDIIEDIEEMARRGDDGFELAKYLDDRGNAEYEFPGDFIDWLDYLSYEYRALAEANVKAWVLAHDIKPALEEGTKLLVNKALGFRACQAGEIVYVNGFSRETGNYLIDADPKKRGGYVLAYEKVEANCSVII